MTLPRNLVMEESDCDDPMTITNRSVQSHYDLALTLDSTQHTTQTGSEDWQA